MDFRQYTEKDTSAIVRLFDEVFSRSEGKEEGKLIGNLAKDLISDTDKQDLYCFVAVENEQIVGSIFFSRLSFQIAVEAFVLAPVAVHSDFQGRGIGQKLILYGLQTLKEDGVHFVVTYGDPKYYSKVGFQPVSQEKIKPPFELSQPEGWLAQPLTGNTIATLSGKCYCVKALDNQAYW